MNVIRISATLSLLGGLATATAHAAESYDNCAGYIDSLPATITTQGTWCLRHDVTTSMSTGDAITVNTNNVTIDCNDFKIGGQAAGLATQVRGIYAYNRRNITVRNCTIRGFRFGILFNGTSTGSGGHVVEDNRLDNNTNTGVSVYGDGSVIRRNLILDTGGGPSPYPTGIKAVYQVNVLDNMVNRVTASGQPSNTFSIVTNYGIGTVSGNRISGLELPASGSVYAIYISHPVRTLVIGNLLLGSGNGYVGVTCPGGSTGIVRVKDNMFDGFQWGLNGCGDAGGNEVMP